MSPRVECLDASDSIPDLSGWGINWLSLDGDEGDE